MPLVVESAAGNNPILKPGRIFAFIVNSTSDPDYGQGSCIEEDFFQIGKDTKRYFNVASARKMVSGFETIILDNRSKAYWQSRRGVHNLIRFVGRKRGRGLIQDLRNGI
jgi:hypothetical protein